MLLRHGWPTLVQNGLLLDGEGFTPQGIRADVLPFYSSIGGLATADVHHCKSQRTTTKTADTVNIQTMVALAVLPNIGPAGMEVEALSGTAGEQFHVVGTIQVDPQSLVLVCNVALATGTPLVEMSTRSFQRHGCWLCFPKSF